MKELLIEEKAKRYDLAIDAARCIYNNMKEGGDFGGMEDLEVLFPELKESEDEKIRKGIINTIERYIEYVVNDENYAPDAKDFLVKELKGQIAWLEKQGKIVEYYEDKLDRCACENFNKGYKKALEKQGEQKPNPYSGTSFEYNGHTWGMCARDNGVEILIDGHIKGRVFTNDSNAKEMFIKALERVEEQNSKGYKLTDCDKNSWWEDFKAYTSCIIEQNPTNEVGNYEHKEVLQTIINEQKLTWSEEDENMWAQVINEIEVIKSNSSTIFEKNIAQDKIDWLKSIKERVQPQSKQEWGEEDEKTIEEAIGYLEKYAEERVQGGNSKQYIFSLASRLDHLRPQNTWKPNDWQMLAINTAINIFGNDTLTRKCLIELQEQLKKLREE